MIKLELISNGSDMVAINRTPKAYAPTGGPKTLAWMRAKGFIDQRRVVQRTRSHAKDCHETCSAYVCSCQTQEKPE